MWYVSSISDSLKTVLRSVLIYGTIILNIYYHIGNSISGVNLIPFKTIFLYITGTGLIKVLNPSDIIDVRILNLFGNLLMFMPMGFFLPNAFHCIKRAV